MKPAYRSILITWLAWALLTIGFQALANARFKPVYPDQALNWTRQFTGVGYQDGRPYLLDPFMNEQVAWDSEYYLAIAVAGYEDPSIVRAGPPENQVPISYAFMPFYPFVIRIVAAPFGWLGMAPIPAATLAGVLVSALGALAAMFALYDLAEDTLGAAGALRAAFYLLIFPTGFFLVQVYTEGLFVGLAFGCLAMIKRGRLLPAALLAAGATLTRAVGVALIFPLGFLWLSTGDQYDLDMEWRQIYFQGLPWKAIGRGLLAAAPLIAFMAWKFSYLGLAFDFVQAAYFGRGFMNLARSFYEWYGVIRNLFGANPAHTAYYLIEIGGLVLGLVASARALSRPQFWGLGIFSLTAIFLSWGSGPAQGMHRYILGAPAVFLVLAEWGKNTDFDRAWTILSLLLMALLSMMFAYNLWVA